MIKRLAFIVLALVVIGGVFFASCSKETTTTTTAAQTTAAGPTEILVGAINSMTGVEAMVGNEHRWAYQQAVKDINAAGGVYVADLGKKLPIRLIVEDDQSDPAGTSAAAEKLIKLQKVDFILGAVDSPLNINGAAVAEKYKKLYVTTTFFPEMFASQNLTWVVDSFFSIVNLCGASVGCLEPIPAADRPKNFCVLVEDNADGQGFSGVAKGIVEGAGYTLALLESYTPGSKDFSSTILRMKAANVDGLITLCSSTDGMTFIRQIKEAKYNLKYIWGARGFWPIEFGESLGKDANYIVSDGHWAEALGAPGSKALGDKFRAEFGATKYSVVIGNPYSLVQALAQAIEKAGSLDNAKVRDVFYSGTFVAKDTTEGDLAFDTHGMATFSAVSLQWMDGKRMPVWPVSPAVWTLKLIPPWDQR
jgi:branched-chain amino acid transport system substrate-binding protein